jgi:hypothetical protein
VINIFILQKKLNFYIQIIHRKADETENKKDDDECCVSEKKQQLEVFSSLFFVVFSPSPRFVKLFILEERTRKKKSLKFRL